MKKLFLIIPFLFFLACGKEKDTPEEIQQTDTTENSEETSSDINNTSDIFGTFTGDFVALKYKSNTDYTHTNRITIFIDSINGDELIGHSVVAGNERPFKGSYKIEDENYIVKASEPGDDKYDGEFSFTIYSSEDKIIGKWKSYDNKLLVTEREYELVKKNFSYNPEIELPNQVSWTFLYDKDRFLQNFEGGTGEALTDDVLKVNPSKAILTKKDIENMHKGDLEIIRNSIYARHGYSFKTRKIRYIFDRYVDWYMPYSTDVRNKLTEIELKNIELLKRYEQHAEAYYDSFGR